MTASYSVGRLNVWRLKGVHLHDDDERPRSLVGDDKVCQRTLVRLHAYFVTRTNESKNPIGMQQ